MATLTALQLRHYLQRIELAPTGAGPSSLPPSTLQTLCAVQWAHLKSIPFENLSLRLASARAHPPSAELDAAFAKLVTARRGGWCFEQNAVFSAALRALGFAVTDGAARVAKLDPPPGEAPPPAGVVPLTPHCAHRVAFVEVGNALYLSDVGFGGDCPPTPIQLPPQPLSYSRASAPGGMGLQGEPWAAGLPLGRAQRYRLSPGTQGAYPDDGEVSADGDGGGGGAFQRRGYYLTALSRRSGEWRPLYFFQMVEAQPQDFEVMNFATSLTPISPFLSNTIVAKATPEGGRLTLLNGSLKAFDAEGDLVEERTAPTAGGDEAALVALLETEFGLGGLR